MVKRKRAAAPELAEQAVAATEDADDAAPVVRKKRKNSAASVAASAGAGAAEAGPGGKAAKPAAAGTAEEEPAPLRTKKKKKKRLAETAPASEAVAAPATTGSTKQKKATAGPGAGHEGATNSDAPAAAGAAAGSSDVERTVFVDGVPYDWTVEKVKELFQQCGSVASARAPTWQDSGRLRGYAHVTFDELAGHKKALAMDGHVIKKGRYLKIEAAKPPADVNVAATSDDAKGKKRLFVKNLPFDAKEADIAKTFGKCGKVVEVRVPTVSGRAKGFAYVEFAKSSSLAKALSLDPVPEMGGRRLRLDVDAGTGPKAGFHYRTEAFEAGFGKGGRGGGRGSGAGGRGRGGQSKIPLF